MNADDECEVGGTVGQSETGLWKLFLQSIIYQKYFPVTWRKMPPRAAAIIYFFMEKFFCPAIPLTSHELQTIDKNQSIYVYGKNANTLNNQFLTNLQLFLKSDVIN